MYKGDVPNTPRIPTAKIFVNFTYQLNWEPAIAYDSQVISYRLKGLIVDNNYKGSTIDKKKYWNLYYKGTENYWIITKDMDQKYRFRVRAFVCENIYGFSAWSEPRSLI